MIRNIVFDLGRVLIDFDPVAYLRGFGYPEETVQTLYPIVFGRDWYLYDRGDYLRIGDLAKATAERYPSYAEQIYEVMRPDWVNIHSLKADTADYLSELKHRGCRVYLLSNLSVDSYEFIRRYDFFHTVDGGVFSYQERSCKPEEKIYRVLLERYSLAPEETVFLDDSPDNIAGAERLGIRGVLFTDLASAQRQTEALLAEGASA